MIENWSFFVRAIITTVCVLYCLFFLIRRQLYEVAQPVDSYTPIRRYIFYLLLVILFTLIPAAVYQWLFTFGYEYKWLRNVVSIIGGITIVALFVCLHLIFTFRVKIGR